MCPMANPMPGAEDFSFVGNEVPSAYLFLSACAHGDPADAGSGNHSPHALFDDAVLPDAAAWLAEAALRRINQGAVKGQPARPPRGRAP